MTNALWDSADLNFQYLPWLLRRDPTVFRVGSEYIAPTVKTSTTWAFPVWFPFPICYWYSMRMVSSGWGSFMTVSFFTGFFSMKLQDRRELSYWLTQKKSKQRNPHLPVCLDFLNAERSMVWQWTKQMDLIISWFVKTPKQNVLFLIIFEV